MVSGYILVYSSQVLHYITRISLNLDVILVPGVGNILINIELENQNKVDSATFIRKSEASSDKNTGNCETNKEISLFEVEARVLDKEVLIGIHCEKQKDIVFKIHALLRNLHLSTTSSTVLPFGTSTLIINNK